ncbi:MAG: tetratricopeptide repeat protein [Bacteroidia bacterium]|nr:tetratricopeptide repeat protein [Bacteroidia bacterium]
MAKYFPFQYKVVSILWILFFLTSQSYSQDPTDDSTKYNFILQEATQLSSKNFIEKSDSLLKVVWPFFEENKDYQTQIEILNIEASNHLRSNRLQEGLSSLGKALKICQDHKLGEQEISVRANMSNLYFNARQPQKSLEQSKLAIELMEDHEVSPSLRAKVFYSTAGVKMVSGEFGEAKSYLREANKAWKEGEEWRAYAVGINGMGVICRNLGQLDSAKIFYEMSEQIFLEHSLGMAHLLFDPVHNQATLALQQGQLEASLSLSRRAMEFAREVDNPSWQAVIYRELGEIYGQMADLEQSELSLKKSIEILEKLNRPRELGKTYQFYSVLNKRQENWDEALKWLNKSSKVFNYNPQEQFVPYASFIEKRAVIYLKKGQHESALKDLREGWELSNKLNFPLWQVAFSTGLAEVFESQSQYDSAQHYALNSVRIADEKGYILEKNGAYDVLFAVLPKVGAYEKAFQLSQQQMAEKDSIFEADLQKTLSKERVKQNLEFAKENQERAEANAALLQTRNNLFLGLIAALAVILIGGGYFFLRLRQNSKQISSQNQELTYLNQTKDHFFGIIAHDLRSPLVAFEGLGKQINHYLGRKSYDKIQQLGGRVDEISQRLNVLLDNLLNWALLQTGTIPYHPEKVRFSEVVEDIFEVFQHNADAKRIQLVSEVDPTIELYADGNALNAILRNLIGNALKFTPEEGRVSVGSEIKNGKAYISVNDTGTGISAEKMEKLFSLDRKSEKGTSGEKGTGLGLILTKDLVELNKGDLEIRSKVGEGSSFIFDLPLVA